MTVWTDDVVRRMKGTPGRPAEDWPPLPAVPDDVAWGDVKRALFETVSTFRAQIAATPPALLLNSADENGSLLDDVIVPLHSQRPPHRAEYLVARM